MIKTDGVSVSILFIRVDDKGEPVKKQKSKKYKEQIDCEYIEKVKITDEIKNMKVVSIDPGCSDLIYCGSKDENGNSRGYGYV